MKNSWRHVLLKLKDGKPRSRVDLPNGNGHCIWMTDKFASRETIDELARHGLIEPTIVGERCDLFAYTITEAGRQALAEWRLSKKKT